MIPFNDPNHHQNQAMGFNPNFSNQNTHLGSLHGNPLSNFYGANPNLQPMAAPNNQVGGAIQLLAMQLQANQQLHQQINLLNQQLQHQGAPQFLLQNPVQNLNPIMGFPNAQFLAQNQLMQGNQVMGLLGNPPLGQNHLNSGFGYGSSPSIMGQNGMHAHWNTKNVQQSNGSKHFQVNHIKANSSNNSSVNSQNSPCKGSPRNFRGFAEGEPSHNRFHKSRLHDMRSSKANTGQYNNKGERGKHNWRDQKLPSANNEEAITVNQRPIIINYSEKEIQEWRDARRKNFPTKCNEKKGASGSKRKEDVKLRCQQLKEVLAKQAELGVEVAEIPPSYLQDPEVKVKNEEENTHWPSTNKFNKRRGRGKGRDHWRAKRQKLKNKGEPSSSSPAVKSEPSLLKKLLSADIKRDKSRLLQVFRFMVLNDFFKQWPDKPLDFPVVNAKDGSEITWEKNPLIDVEDSLADEAVDEKIKFEEFGSEKESSVANEMGNGFDEEETGSTSNEDNCPEEMEDNTEEQFEKTEEGEIAE